MGLEKETEEFGIGLVSPQSTEDMGPSDHSVNLTGPDRGSLQCESGAWGSQKLHS